MPETDSIIRAEQEAAPQAQPQKPAKVTFDQIQQEKVNELIREAQGRAARDLRTELEAARAAAAAQSAELSLYKNGADPALQEARQKLAIEQTARTAAEQREKRAEANVVLRDLLQQEAVIGVADATRLLADSVTWKGGKLQGADGRPVEVVVHDFVSSRPHLVRSSVRSGAGATEAAVPLRAGEPKLADLFGKGSSGKMANDLALSRPQEYRRLRARARAEGLIA
jgi:hypothetical protein